MVPNLFEVQGQLSRLENKIETLNKTRMNYLLLLHFVSVTCAEMSGMLEREAVFLWSILIRSYLIERSDFTLKTVEVNVISFALSKFIWKQLMLWEISGTGSRPQLEEEKWRMLASQLLVFFPGRTWCPWLLMQRRKQEDSGEYVQVLPPALLFLVGSVGWGWWEEFTYRLVCTSTSLQLGSTTGWTGCVHQHQNPSEIGCLLVAVGQIWVSGAQQTKAGGKSFSWECEGCQEWRSAMLFQVGVLSLVC